jgi:hypothetical protein
MKAASEQKLQTARRVNLLLQRLEASGAWGLARAIRIAIYGGQR